MKFVSQFKPLAPVSLPQFSGTRVMMLPLILGDLTSIPANLSHYRACIQELFRLTAAEHLGKVGYLTIDEKEVSAGATHRRQGLHVDGVYRGQDGGWGGGGGGWGGGGGDGKRSTGMITVSSIEGCRAYQQEFEGIIGNEGECAHLAAQCQQPTTFQRNFAYWVDGLCVHESLPMSEDTRRQFVRLSMPSTSPWFEGYTENPLGVKPTGPILAAREFMKI